MHLAEPHLTVLVASSALSDNKTVQDSETKVVNLCSCLCTYGPSHYGVGGKATSACQDIPSNLEFFLTSGRLDCFHMLQLWWENHGYFF